MSYVRLNNETNGMQNIAVPEYCTCSSCCMIPHGTVVGCIVTQHWSLIMVALILASIHYLNSIDQPSCIKLAVSS